MARAFQDDDMPDAVIRLDWDEARLLVSQARQVIVTGHARPDADDLGAICALAQVLAQQGKSVLAAVEGGAPEDLRFIPGADGVASAVAAGDADLIVSCDSSDKQNLGAIRDDLAAIRAPWLVIDHHVTNKLFGDVHLVDSTAASTTELLQRWFERERWPITPAIAECLLYGVLTDTQVFRVGPVTAETFERVSRLTRLGADFAAMRAKVAESQRLAMLRLIGRALSRAQCEDGVAWAWLDVPDFLAEGVPAKRNVGVADDMLSVKGAVIGAEFAATDEGTVRVSLRCADGYNVGDIAVALGGGGHAKAAGGAVRGMPLDQAVAHVVALLKQQALR
jgi:phosphoesterase RecJ-like protein